MKERGWQRHPGALLVVAYKSLCRQRGAQSFQIHGQKGHVGSDVTVAELVVELETIENPGPVVEAIDVCRLEIAVAVTDLSSGDAGGEQPLSTVPVAPALAHHVVVRSRL